MRKQILEITNKEYIGFHQPNTLYFCLMITKHISHCLFFNVFFLFIYLSVLQESQYMPWCHDLYGRPGQLCELVLSFHLVDPLQIQST